jgi:hypothetical protein
MIAVVDYSNAADPLAAMKAAAIARRAKLYAPEPKPVAQPVVALEVIAPAPEPEPEPKPDPVRDWIIVSTPAAALRPASSSLILSMVTQETGVSRLDILSDRRGAKIVRPRQIAYYLMRHCTPLSLPEIGRRMGKRDHTSVLSGVRKITNLLQSDAALRATIDSLAARINAIVGADIQAEIADNCDQQDEVAA